MKTERRHELQTNVLADSLARWIDKAKPYSRAGLAIVIALVVAIFAWGYLSAQNSRRQADGWTEYFEAMMQRDPRDSLSDIVVRYAGLPVAEWSRLVLADIQLESGTNRLFVDRAGARDELRGAAETYQAVLIETSQPTLEQRATFGLARAHEAMGTLAKAREEYRTIAKKWPDGPYAQVADARADDLERMDTKSFYDWFAKYEPPRPLANEPGTPGVRPDFLKDPLEGGGAKLPSVIDGNSAAPDLSLEPAGEGNPPADSKPEGDQPPDANPSEPAADSSDKPASDASAGDKPAEPAAPKPE